MPLTAFQARGNTQSIQASSAGSTPVQVCAGNQQGMFVANPTTSPIYITDGTSSILAVYPTTSAPARGLCIPAGLAGAFITDPHGWLSVATSAGTANVFATPGFGG
jgi:hypothetical protein